ncbi:Uncharacterised protein [Paraprevotella clara]|uniref:Uncharacterized protein n=1 Tax=Paraprevotella clara TaxID=454154 RepID=A0A6N3C5H1_9BACT
MLIKYFLYLCNVMKKRADKKKSLGDYDRQNTVTKSLQAYFLK